MVQLIMLRLNQIMNRRTRCNDTFREVIHTETFQRDCVKMLIEYFDSIVFSEDPIVEHSQVIFCAKQVDKVLSLVALHQHLGGTEALQQLVYVFVGALSQVELASRNIQKCYTGRLFVEMNRSQKIVLFLLKYIVIIGDAWGHQFHHPSFDQLFGQLWVFKLLAYSHF